MFSLETLFLLFGIFQLFAGVVALIIAKRLNDVPSKFLAYSCFMYSIGMGVILTRNYTPMWFGLGIGNFFPILSLFFMQIAIQSIFKEYEFQTKNILFASIITSGYSSLFPMLKGLNMTAYFPILAGIGLGITNLFVVWNIPKEIKENIYLKIIIFISYSLCAVWLIRGVIGTKAGFIFALDASISNWVLSSLLLFLSTIRIVIFIAMRLDKSYKYQETLEQLNASLFEAVNQKNEIHAHSKELEDGMLDALKN